MGSKSKIGLVELKMRNEDGTPISRLQMEEQLRNETVYHRRLRAFKLGLPNKIVQHMLPISITHWLLDHWVQNGTIIGEVLGIRSEFDADDNKEYVRQLTQRLALFVEHGLAVKPNPGEGIDMSQFNGTPPGFPPPLPPMPGAPVIGSVTPVQGNFTPPPPPMPGMSMPSHQMQPPPMAGGVGSGFPQQQNIGGYPPGMPPMPGIPQPTQQVFQPQQIPQQAQPTAGVPTKSDPTRQWGKAGKNADGSERKRRTKEEVGEDAAYEAWTQAGGDPNVGSVQQQAPQHVQQQQVPQQHAQMQVPTQLAPPNPFGNLPPQQFQMPQQATAMPAQPQQVAPTGVTPEEFANLMNRMSLVEKGIAQILRVLYSQQGEADLYLVLTEVCRIRP